MNWLNKFLLYIFLFPKSFYKKLGCNMQHLEAILTVKLMMDDRRPSSFHQMRKQQHNKKEISNATLWGMLSSLFMGLFYLMVFTMSDDYTTNLTLFFTLFIVLLSLTLITDFTNVLLDVRDNFIILPKPVNDRTFVLSRLLHIIIHISKMVLPISIPTAVFITVQKGFVGFILFIPLVILATLFTVFLINAFYLIILKITTPEKFKNIISYIQIAFAIGIYAGWQVLPRMIAKANGDFNISKYKWMKLLPTYWFANAWNSLYTFTFNSTSIVCIPLATFTPIVLLLVVIKYFAPSFNQKLTLITSGSIATNTLTPTKENLSKKNYSEWWAKLITKSGTERMGFLFTWKMMLRSRDFKMKVYPGIGYMIVIIFVMLFREKKVSLTEMSAAIAGQTSSGRIFILLIIYFSSLMIVTALGGIVMSDKYKAAWIYFITPISNPGEIIAGSIKAVTVMFFFPLATIALVVSTGFIGFSVIPNMILAISNQLFIITIMSMSSVKYLPFSTTLYKPNFLSVMKNFTMMIIGGLVGIIHFFIYPYTWLVLVLIIVSLVATYFLFKTISRYNWSKIISEYRED